MRPSWDKRAIDFYCNKEKCSCNQCKKRREKTKKMMSDRWICLACKKKCKKEQRDGAYHKACRPESGRS